MKRLRRIMICGNYGATNLGDEAILQSILKTARAHFLGATFMVVSTNRQETATRYNVETISPMPAGLRSWIISILTGRLIGTLREYHRARFVIFGGGGLFSDEKPLAMIIWTMQILPALWFRKKIFCYGQSVGPLKSRWSRWVVRKIFRRFTVVTVRDEASRMLLERLDVRNMRVFPDPVFGLEMRGSTKAVRQPYVVFSLRSWKNYKPYEVLAEFTDWIFERYKLRTYFMPFQTLHDDDSSEMQKVFSKLKNPEAAEVLNYRGDIFDVLEFIREATAVVGMRLHSLIFSAITHTPFLALSYSQKVTEVVGQLGMEDFLCDYSSLDLAEMKKKFEKLMNERTKIENLLLEKQREFAKETKKYSDLLKDF